MKKQKLIAASSLGLFTEQVNSYLSNDWAVIPETLKIKVAIAKGEGSASDISAFVVVVEKEV